MKILIITPHFYPEQFQINEIATELVKRGNEVTVLCGMPNYPKGEYFEGYESLEACRGRDNEYEEVTGVKVIRAYEVARGRNVIGLLRNYWSFAKNTKRSVNDLQGDFDLVLGYQLSPVTSMAAAVKYKRVHNVPLVYYVLDLWPVSAAAMLKGKKNPLYPVVGWISRKIYKEADRLLVTSRPFIDYLSDVNGVSIEKMHYLPQHAGDEMMNMNLTAVDNGVTDFMFAGNFGKGQRLDVVVNAAAELGRRDDYKIHMVGDGSMREELEKMVIEKGLQDNFIFYGNQKRDDMPEFYKKADVLLITLRGNNEVGNTMPGKLQMYMTTGKPIIGAINGAAQEVIRDAECGECVAAGDYLGLSKLMLKYIENPSLHTDSSAGQNARAYFKANFTLDKFMDGLCRELEEVENSKR